MNTGLSQETNTIIQTYAATMVLVELKNTGLVESDFWLNAEFDDQNVKQIIEQVGIDNQGSLMMALYSMLVVPRQMLEDRYPTHYDKVESFLSNNCYDINSTYPVNPGKVPRPFVRHLRNATAHAQIMFEPHDHIKFSDEYNRKGWIFEAKLPLVFVGSLMNLLRQVHFQFIRDLDK